jgi:urease accessory protein
MPTKGLYELMSWMSPSYPVGAYTYSHGLEYAVEADLITDIGGLVPWMTSIMTAGGGRNDGILFTEAYRAAAEEDMGKLVEITELAHACRSTKEMDLETSAQGRAFVTVTSDVFPSRSLQQLKQLWQGPITYPVAVAVVAADKKIELEVALTAYFHGFISNLVSAAVRIIPLGQTDGQRAIAALQEVTARQVHDTLFSTLDDLGTATVMVDWCSCQHETQYTRLFRS